MRIGIYGGTFNPVHFGHLINAEYVRGTCFLDKIIFVPSRQPVHKSSENVVSPEDRVMMLSLAIEGNPCFETSKIEIDRGEPSYTIYTVREMLVSHPDWEIFLIIGSDSFNEISTWKEYQNLIALASFIVISRQGHDPDPAMLKLFGIDKVPAKRPAEFNYGRRKIVFAKNPVIEISSSCIRDRLQKNLSVRYLLPDNVMRYIYEKGLYRN